jgi:hypothetical protein
MGMVPGWTVAQFESEHALARCGQSFLFFAQEFPGFFVADFSLAELLDHRPNLRSVIVGPFVKSVRRTRKYWLRLHWGRFRDDISSNY